MINLHQKRLFTSVLDYIQLLITKLGLLYHVLNLKCFVYNLKLSKVYREEPIQQNKFLYIKYTFINNMLLLIVN
jgi:hypothetical protein